MNIEEICSDCGAALGQPGTRHCSACSKRRLTASYEVSRQELARYEVSPPGSPWIEGVTLDMIYPQECYLRAYSYACDNSRCFQEHQLVHGSTSFAFGGHAWIELPIGLIFDGVYQRFYRKEDYYGVMAHATPWYFYESDAARMLGAHLRTSPGKWWFNLGLPMIIGGRSPIIIDSEKAWAGLIHYYKQCDEALLKKVPTSVLRAVVKEGGIGVTRGMKKSDLIQAILQSQQIVSAQMN